MRLPNLYNYILYNSSIVAPINTGPPVVESSGTGVGAGSTTLSISAPSGIQDGDLLLMYVAYAYAGDDFTLPSGFTNIPIANAGGNIRGIFAWKIASGESGDYVVSWPATPQASGVVLRISNHNGIDTLAQQYNVSLVNTHTAPAATAASDQSLVLRTALRQRGQGAVITTPPTTIVVSQQGSTALDSRTTAISGAVQAVAGTTGTADFSTPSSTARAITITTIIKPAGAA